MPLGVLSLEAIRAEGVKGALPESIDVMPKKLPKPGEDTKLKSEGVIFSGRFKENWKSAIGTWSVLFSSRI